ncbi:MAG: M23 family metallopeptidase [Rhodospirillales bacterium]|nr:M23 family metallopeptidase [Rhodospirillales bacterium]
MDANRQILRVSFVPGAFRAFLVVAFVALGGAGPAFAQAAAESTNAPSLGLPIRCQLGRDCWLVNLVDVDSGPGRRDYTCSKRTYDGHKGVDIAIRDLKAMKKGVAVLASAEGVVRGARDGMADIDFTRKDAPEIKDRECGNGVVLIHDDGWETQYCHMRRGSVTVKTGDTVKRGQMLGLVGHSGRAQFPHVHLSVRNNKQVVDPFLGYQADIARGGQDGGKCGLGAAPLWDKGALATLTGEMTALYNFGFASGAPKPRAARAGILDTASLSRKSAALVMWVDVYWVEVGDMLTIEITGPDGKSLVKRDTIIKKTQARNFSFVGKKRKIRLWPPGAYRGRIELVRGKGATKQMVFKAERMLDVR